MANNIYLFIKNILFYNDYKLCKNNIFQTVKTFLENEY